MAAVIERIIEPRSRDIGGLAVRRVLPVAARRRVGPFIFFDHMGPVDFPPGAGIDVPPHPHIGLATVTYLFAGAIVHRDSLGAVQTIRPGDVNWMIAGRGIVHSERTADADRADGAHAHGIQSWVALPTEDEEAEPAFRHHPAETLPRFEQDGVAMRLIAGTAYGERAPVDTYSEMFYVDAELAARAWVAPPAEHEERAVYVVDGAVTLGGERLTTAHMAVLEPGGDPVIRAETAARVMMLGGARLRGERFMWWNFVSSSKARLEQAKDDWAGGRFEPVPGETEFTPLPDR
jgi:redox-sensitive bicupin YhaK (pirin superfamily)